MGCSEIRASRGFSWSLSLGGEDWFAFEEVFKKCASQTVCAALSGHQGHGNKHTFCAVESPTEVTHGPVT